MPRGRMLNKEISVSKKLPKVSVYARLLFTWSIPHLDVGGKIFGNPEQIKGNIVPYCNDFTIKMIKKCLIELQENELIIVYGEENCQYLYFPGFQSNQNINELRESPSLIPEPIPEQLQSKSSETLSKVKLSKVKISKAELAGESLDQILKSWNNFADKNNLSKIIKLTDKRLKKLRDRLEDNNFLINEILLKISESSFLLGNNDRKWKVDFDFVIENETNFVKILEGKYNNKSQPKVIELNT